MPGAVLGVVYAYGSSHGRRGPCSTGEGNLEDFGLSTLVDGNVFTERKCMKETDWGETRKFYFVHVKFELFFSYLRKDIKKYLWKEARSRDRIWILSAYR